MASLDATGSGDEPRRGITPLVAKLAKGSRTADIEQTIVIGAHGPYRVHIVLTAAPC